MFYSRKTKNSEETDTPRPCPQMPPNAPGPLSQIKINILEAKGRYAPHPAARRFHVAIVSCHEAKARDAPER